MSRDAGMYLEDILRSCEKILEYVKGLKRDEFVRDTRTYYSVIRNLEILGEAAKNLPSELKEELPNIEWRKISGLRDFLAHAYFGIDDDILWDVVENKIPQLGEKVGEYLSD